jgi:aryl-alcohol dehydrogenase-like predicted oxidoreductase
MDMTTIPLGQSPVTVSRLAYGCWRIAGSWEPAKVTAEGMAAGRRAVLAAYEASITRTFIVADAARKSLARC